MTHIPADPQWYESPRWYWPAGIAFMLWLWVLPMLALFLFTGWLLTATQVFYVISGAGLLGACAVAGVRKLL